MLAVLERARGAAQSDTTLCLSGPSGTGKKLLARAIHGASRRMRGPYVTVACGGVPEGLLEAELFGYSKGAFAAATRDRAGCFQAADGGTLFVDEVCDLPLALQVKLVRALEERRVRPVGSEKSVAADVRLLCATRRNIAQQVSAGALRGDLAAWLLNANLSLPSLAERREDIPLLAGHFLAQCANRRRGSASIALSSEALGVLTAASWPGNIAQLRYVIERAAAASSAQMLSAVLVRQVLDSRDATWVPLDEARRVFERRYLVHILEITGGNVTRAARLAGRNRTEFYRLLDRHSLQPSIFKGVASPH